jgi:hypothetical protein
MMKNFQNDFNDEFYFLIKQLKGILNTDIVNVVGIFHWDTVLIRKGVVKKKYFIKKTNALDLQSENNSLMWFLNYSDTKLEMIQDFRKGNMGEVLLFRFKRNGKELKKTSVKLLKIR